MPRRVVVYLARVLVPLVFPGVVDAGPIEDYVAKPDPNYAWRTVHTQTQPEGTFAVLYLTSQAWRTGKDVDRILWRHWLELYIPNQVEHDTGLLVIGGGDNSATPPTKPDGSLAQTAIQAKAVVAEVRNVPNQPLVFLSDPDLRVRTEDDILAFCWARHLETGDPEWLAQLAMVKSAVRAMDAVTEFCAARERPVTLKHFVVSGASKRGWTTWLAAAADRRVVAVAPMVIDFLNLDASFRHHHAAYGRYADAVHPYVENGIMARMGEPAAQASVAILDPFAYRDRMTMPKLLINSTGDQFFLPDSWRFYWSDLPGPTYIRYIPNTDHGLDRSSAESLRSFFVSVLAGKPLPAFAWREEAPGRLRVESRTTPKQVLAWTATNPAARDFILGPNGPTWSPRELSPEGAGVYLGVAPQPAKGWSAIVVELVFPDPTGSTAAIRLTTGVSVTPARLPFPETPDAAGP